MLSFIKSFNIQPPGGGVDNTPNSVNWVNIYWHLQSLNGEITSQQITGISSSIDLNILGSTRVDLYYQVTSSQITGTNTSAPPSSPWTKISSDIPGTTFSVNNNQWVSFCCYGTTNNKDETINVINASDSNASLDSFHIITDGN